METKKEVSRRYAKYIFLDVVQFSSRSAEAQSEIVQHLNEIVRQTLDSNNVNYDEDCILIPTGDGMCIALISPILPYDAHIQIALNILELIQKYNDSTENETRRFQVRIGINQNTDILVTDINGRRNIAGAGINMAARVMDTADGGQILVSQAVFHELQPSEAYMDKFKHFSASVKHNIRLQVYQFLEEGHVGLNIDIPSSLKEPEPKLEPEEKLPPIIAYYLAYAIKHRKFISTVYKGFSPHGHALQILLYFLALDSYELTIETDSKLRYVSTWKFREATFEEQFEHYKLLESTVASALREFIGDVVTSPRERLFETSGLLQLFVSNKGKQKLKDEYPDIWNEFNLDEYSETK